MNSATGPQDSAFIHQFSALYQLSNLTTLQTTKKRKHLEIIELTFCLNVYCIVLILKEGVSDSSISSIENGPVVRTSPFLGAMS